MIFIIILDIFIWLYDTIAIIILIKEIRNDK